MNFQFYVEKLKDSKDFNDFIRENPKAFMCSGFFTIDLEKKDDQRHIDFYIPVKKEVVSFRLDGTGSGDEDEGVKDVERIPSKENFGTNIQQEFLVPEEIDSETDFDLEEVKKIVEREMKKQEVKNKLQKIMISLQKAEGKDLLVCTIFISMMGILNIHIDPKTKKVIQFKKKSFLDFVRKAK